MTRRGTLAALAVGAATTWGLGWRGLVLLGAFLISGSLLTRGAAADAAGRTATQVLANGGLAALAALAGSWVIFAGAIAAATADTWATEIGAFSRTPPRLIIGGAPVPTGTSGGITALGTAGGVLGAALMGGLAVLLGPRASGPGSTNPGKLAAVVAAAGVLGMIVDSVLGATLQACFECPECGARTERRDFLCHEPVRLIRGYRWLNNDTVNLTATIAGAAVAALGGWVLALSP